MKHKLLTALFLLTIICGCGSYVQVIETKTENTNIEDDMYVYENDSIKITYDFWQEKGLLSFTIYNKLNRPVYVDWKKSSYINKGVKRNFWEDTESTKTLERHSGYSYRNSNLTSRQSSLSSSFTNSINTSSSETVKPEKITFIPPKSNYTRSQFFLLPIPFLKIKNYPNIKEMPKLNNEEKTVEYQEKDFNKDDTPLIFRNFLTLSYSENFDNEFYVDNEFYISNVIKVETTQFQGYMRNTKKNGGLYELDENGRRIIISPFQKGTSFYLKMEQR
jgi:hypothetical protein